MCRGLTPKVANANAAVKPMPIGVAIAPKDSGAINIEQNQGDCIAFTHGCASLLIASGTGSKAMLSLRMKRSIFF